MRILGSTVMPPGRRIERQSDARANASGSPDARGNVSDLAGTEGTGHRNMERLARKMRISIEELTKSQIL
jgi:hypothetical protein